MGQSLQIVFLKGLHSALSIGRWVYGDLRLCQASQVVKNPPANAGDGRDTGSIPELGRSPGAENGNPLQYSYPENSMDRGARWATVRGVAKSQTLLSMHTFIVYCSSVIPSLYFGTIDNNWTLASAPGLKPSPVWCIFLFIYAFIHYSIFLLVHWTRSLTGWHIFNQVLC